MAMKVEDQKVLQVSLMSSALSTDRLESARTACTTNPFLSGGVSQAFRAA